MVCVVKPLRVLAIVSLVCLIAAPLPSQDIIKEEWEQYSEVASRTGTPTQIWEALTTLSKNRETVALFWDIKITGPSALISDKGNLQNIVSIDDPNREAQAKAAIGSQNMPVVEVADLSKADVRITVKWAITTPRGGRQTLITMNDLYYQLEELESSIILAENSLHFHILRGFASTGKGGPSQKIILNEWR